MTPAEMQALAAEFRAQDRSAFDMPDDVLAFAALADNDYGTLAGRFHRAAAWFAGRQSAPAHTPTPDVLAKMAEAVILRLHRFGLTNLPDPSANPVSTAAWDTARDEALEAMHSVLPTIAETRPQVDAFLAAHPPAESDPARGPLCAYVYTSGPWRDGKCLALRGNMVHDTSRNGTGRHAFVEPEP